MMNLLEFLLQQLAAAGLNGDDVARVIVPVDDPRVPNGKLVLDRQAFADAAGRVNLADARRDILIVLQPPAVDGDGEPIIPPPLERTVAWLDGAFRVVRGPGAVPYNFGPNDLLAPGA